MTPEDRYHFELLFLSVEAAIGRGESVGQYHHSEVLRLLRAAGLAPESPAPEVRSAIDGLTQVERASKRCGRGWRLKDPSRFDR